MTSADDTGRISRGLLDALRQIDSLDYLRDRLGAGLDESSLLQNLAGDLEGGFEAEAVSIFLLDIDSYDFEQRHTSPPEHSETAVAEFEQQVESETVAWVIGNRRAGIFRPRVFPRERGQSLLLAPLTTGHHTLGILLMYVAEKEEHILSGKLALLSLLTKLYSFSLENLALRQRLTSLNEHLEAEVAQRSQDLAEAHSRLTRKHGELRSAYDELQKLDQSKDNFISLTSHELRTPLTSVICCAEILRDGMYEGEAQLAEFLGTIHTEASRLLALVNDILDLSKVESGKLTFRMLPLEMAQPIQQSLELFRSKAQAKGITLHAELACNGSRVEGDPERLMQVMANLLSNAIKFTPEGGRITVRTTLEGDKLRVCVSDTGIGIARQDLPKVFSKFEQVERTEHHTEGTGLGMPISKAIVEAHSGTMWVESEPGRGSDFVFTLPLLPNRVGSR